MDNDYKVYMHTSPNGKKYVGITKQKVEQRWGKNGYGYRHNQYFYKAIQKYGWNNFKHEVLYTHLTKKEAEEIEINLIAEYKCTNKKYRYNIENGGNCSSTHSKSTIEKIRKANLGNKNPMYGKHMQDNPNFKRVPKICNYCGKNIFVLKCRENRSKHFYCSKECKYKDFKNTNTFNDSKVEVVCDNCNKIIKKYPSQIYKHNYCSKECQNNHYKKLFKGEKNPNYRNGNRMNK